jgi:hypothetical protein
MANLDPAEVRVRRALKVGPSTGQEGVLRIGRSVGQAQTDASWRDTDATRYLSASAYLSTAFRKWVIAHFTENRHRALTASYGIDQVLVLKHCLNARRIEKKRDLLLLIPVLFAVLGLLLALSEPTTLPITIFVSVLAAFAIIAWEHQEVNFKIVRQNFTKKNYNPDALPLTFDAKDEMDFRDVEQAQKSNVIIYGDFSPFVGYGSNIGAWSFTVDLSKGKQDLTGRFMPRPFQVSEIYADIRNRLQSLELPNCSVEDKLCTSGLDVRDTQFLPKVLSRPQTWIESSEMEDFVAHPTPRARHYQVFRLVDWSGELVLSSFLRAFKSGYNLCVEVSYCLLVPLAEGHRAIDSMNPLPTWKDWSQLLAGAAGRTMFLPFWLPVSVSEIISSFFKSRHSHREDELVAENPTYNHGAFTSLRQATASDVYRRYFQKLDKEMYMKILERHILDSIVHFLDDRNIDTSELRETRSQIINSGIIVSGGSSVEANTLAVGQGSTATSQQSGRGAIRFVRELTNRGTSQPSNQ